MLTFTFTMDLGADIGNHVPAIVSALREAALALDGACFVDNQSGGTVEDGGRVVASWEVTGTVTPKCDWCGGPLVKPVKSRSGALTFCTAACKVTLDNAKVVPGRTA